MSKIESALFLDLYNTAKKSSDESTASTSLLSKASKKLQEALQESLGDAAKAAKVAAQKAKLSFKYFEQERSEEADDIKAECKTVSSTVNWLLSTFKDMIDKINDQGELMAAIVKRLKDVTDSEASNEELKQKHDDLVQKCIDLEKRLDALDARADETGQNELKQKQLDLENKTKDMETVFDKKCVDLDKKCDEVRQRGLKGNLIISNPAKTSPLWLSTE